MHLIPPLTLLTLQLASAANLPGSANQPTLSNATPQKINTTATAANTSALAYDSLLQYVGPADASPKVKCDRIYGSNMDRGSCFDAWQRFQWHDTRKQFFAQRGTVDKIEQVMPKRISSIDGKCVIDVVPGARKPSYDISSFEEIRQAATRIMESCVDATPNPRNTGRGGYMGGIGLNKNLVVIVRKYVPNIRCGSPWRSPMACAPVLDKLPVKTDVQVFGRVDVSEADVIVPNIWRADITKCAINVDIYTHYTRATADKVSWFDLWAAAEALNAVCLWHGKEGIATSLGLRHSMIVTAYDETHTAQ